jgi:hypothetical protein
MKGQVPEPPEPPEPPELHQNFLIKYHKRQRIFSVSHAAAVCSYFSRITKQRINFASDAKPFR